MNKDTLKALDFDKVLASIGGFAHSDISREAVSGISPLASMQEIERRFDEVEEIRRLTREGTPLRIRQFENISGLLEKNRPEDAVLEGEELALVGNVLDILQALSGQISDTVPSLAERAGNITGFPEVLAAIERAVDGEGNIKDGASPLLSELRGRRRALEARIRKRLEEIVEDGKVRPFLQSDFVTKRSGRWVIPVRMDSKGQVAGVVHDVSRSGDTAFVEPVETIGLANELENLAAEEKAEEIRILRDISRRLRLVAGELRQQFDTLVHLDAMQCIASYAELFRANRPEINNARLLRLLNARHPVLLGLKKEVVPLNASLGGGDSVLVITGPNAGGKTIAIKTAGLLLCMALSGIPVTADPSSSFPLAGDVLVDIGDEQSIEQNLSTFSAHVSKISRILAKANSGSVVLLDELGTGTDPVQGAAIACAVLKGLWEKGAFVLATTHLLDIVAFVQRTAGMVNASMEFDAVTMTPLYRLKTGEPGQSHALEIARRYGLPAETLELAGQMLGRMKVDFYELLEELKAARAEHEKALAEMESLRAALDKERFILGEKLAEAEGERKKMLDRAYAEVRELILEAKKEVNAVLDEARREKAKAKEAARKLALMDAEIAGKMQELAGLPSLNVDEIAEGHTVFVKTLGREAVVSDVDRKRLRVKVRAGDMEFELPVSALAPWKGHAPEPAPTPPKVEAEEKNIPRRLYLLGKRVDEALPELERFINEAFLAGVGEVVIVHGVGTGALRKAVRDYLKGHLLAKGFRAGQRHEGGAGVTVVSL